MADNNDKNCSLCHLYAAAPLLRIWIGLRILFAGGDKFKKGDTYSLENYWEKMNIIAAGVAENSFIPGWAAGLYAKPLGFIMLFVGVWVLMGLVRIPALFFAGLIFISLSFGVMVLPDDTSTIFLGMHVGLVAGALALTPWDRLSLDGIFKRGVR